jgi:hypothetical protein
MSQVAIPSVDPQPIEGVEAANTAWGCTCAPVAIAGALGLQLPDVRQAVSPGGRFRGFMTVPDVRRAMTKLGARVTEKRPAKTVDLLELPDALGQIGDGPMVIILQWCGPWDSVPRAAATRRHAIAYQRAWLRSPDQWAQRSRGPGIVLDANTPCERDAAPWIPAYVWRNIIVPDLLPRRASWRVLIQWAAAVSR